MPKIKLRMAEKKDIDAICKILAPYAKKKIVLPREPVEVLKHIHNFCVAEKNGRTIACCAFRDYGNKLFEIRSLAVNSRNIGGGIGSKMVNFLKERISVHGDVKVFALTTSAGFFHRLGFRTVEKDMFPQKIWSDCSKCPKLNDCDEEAVMINHEKKL